MLYKLETIHGVIFIFFTQFSMLPNDYQYILYLNYAFDLHPFNP